MMKAITSFFKNRKGNYYLIIASFLLALCGLIVYIKTGTNDFSLKINTTVIVSCIIGLVFCFIPIIINKFRILYFFPWFCFFFAFLNFITSQVNYIANVLVSIDGSSLSAGFLATAILLLLSAICSLISGCLTKENSVLKDNTNKEKTNYVN